ncbi:MAG: 30S ribosomal protein S19e [Nanoarchaeota archaeon]|nr:30S ribosomal protein S19e [Nanoarchaeota archaeon]MBU1855054.1 30S ribosomal protein S19e [Nanoarchaeota archaeon]
MLLEVPQNELIKKTAEELKKLIDMPSWALFVKTGTHKQRPPVESDWWYMRAASVLRQIYLLGPIGVSKLRTKYGGKKNRGMKPEKFYKGSGAVIRKILQQLEAAKLIKQHTIKKHKGRVITPKGKSLLFSVAKIIRGPVTKNKEVKQKEKPVEKPKENKIGTKDLADYKEDNKQEKQKEQKEEKSKTPKKEKTKTKKE